MGTWSGLMAGDIANLKAGKLYVNVHTAANPFGDIRGQILKPAQVFYVTLANGANATPMNASTETAGAGFILDGMSLAYGGTTTIAAPTAVTINPGTASMTGAALYTLMMSGSSFEGTQAVTAGDITALDASGLYLNITSAAFTGGEVRGLIKKSFVAP